jgi:hypothetical protein
MRGLSAQLTGSVVVAGLAATVLVSGCSVPSGSAAQTGAETPRPAAQATGGLFALNPASARGDSACALIPANVISAVLRVTPRASAGPSPGYMPGTSCEYEAIAAGYSLTVTFYPDMGHAAFAAEDFQPKESAQFQWARTTVHIGDQSIAWNVPAYGIIAFREGHRVVVIGLFAAVSSPPDAAWTGALKLAVSASRRI